MTKRTCSIEHCDRKHNARGLCITHYSRWRKTGEARPDEPVRPREWLGECVVDGCDRLDVKAHGMCIKHAERWRRSGRTDDPVLPAGDKAPNWRGDDIVYRSAHTRITKAFGPATNYTCVDCGGQAEQWSYDHNDPDEKMSDEGFAYSPNVNHYQPRCRLCHIHFDEIPSKLWRNRERSANPRVRN